MVGMWIEESNPLLLGCIQILLCTYEGGRKGKARGWTPPLVAEKRKVADSPLAGARPAVCKAVRPKYGRDYVILCGLKQPSGPGEKDRKPGPHASQFSRPVEADVLGQEADGAGSTPATED